MGFVLWGTDLAEHAADDGFFSSISNERYGLFVTEGGCREYGQGNLCNLFTGP